jgi:hypothetical protein
MMSEYSARSAEFQESDQHKTVSPADADTKIVLESVEEIEAFLAEHGLDLDGIGDKTGSKRSRKFSPADGNFLRYLRSLGYFDPIPAGDTTLVEASSIPISPSISPSDSESLLSRVIDRRIARWAPLPGSVDPLKPKTWASVGYELKALFYHLALRKQPYVRGFTLRLSEAVEKRARSQKSSPSRYLHKQLNQEIKREFERAGWASKGQQTPFWFVVEEDKSGRLHLHGEIAFDPAQREAIRAGMKTAAGEWREADEDRTNLGKQHQLVFSRGKPDAGWAAYLCKCLAHATEPRRRYMTRFGSPKRWVVWYAGKPLSATDQLKREAAALYEQARADAIDAGFGDKSGSTGVPILG